MERMLEATARAEDRHFWFIGLRRAAKQVLGPPAPTTAEHRVLDCGCGTGRNLLWLADYGHPIGVELTPAGLRLSARRGVPVIRATVATLPVASGTIDLATSFDVLYCLSAADERRAVDEMFRVLKPGGRLLVNAAALELLRGAHSTLTHEQRRYTRSSLKALLTGAGFTVERLTYTNMATFPLTLVVRVFDRLTGRAAQASDTELRVPPAPVNWLLDLALRLEHVALRVANLPIGTSVLCVARKPAGTERSVRPSAG